MSKFIRTGSLHLSMNTTEMLYNLNEMRYVAESASEDDRLEKIPKRARVAK